MHARVRVYGGAEEERTKKKKMKKAEGTTAFYKEQFERRWISFCYSLRHEFFGMNFVWPKICDDFLQKLLLQNPQHSIKSTGNFWNYFLKTEIDDFYFENKEKNSKKKYLSNVKNLTENAVKKIAWFSSNEKCGRALERD